MSDWWVPVVSAGAALTGVGLASYLQSRRERITHRNTLQDEAFTDLYAWAFQADDVVEVLIARRAPAMVGKEAALPPPEVPQPSYELLARTFMYLDKPLAREARGAGDAVRRLAATSLEDHSAFIKELSEASRMLGRLTARLSSLSKKAQAGRVKKARWRVARWQRRSIRMGSMEGLGTPRRRSEWGSKNDSDL
jgi:hypothetical protein